MAVQNGSTAALVTWEMILPPPGASDRSVISTRYGAVGRIWFAALVVSSVFTARQPSLVSGGGAFGAIPAAPWQYATKCCMITGTWGDNSQSARGTKGR